MGSSTRLVQRHHVCSSSMSWIPLAQRAGVAAERQGILESTLKKTPVAPNVPMDFLARITEGFSGADLAGLCQHAAKAGIRDAIAAEELKAGDDAMDADGMAEIGRKHFEEAYDHSRASVSATDLTKYDQFRKKYDPKMKS